jgi:hypothetical protein
MDWASLLATLFDLLLKLLLGLLPLVSAGCLPKWQWQPTYEAPALTQSEVAVSTDNAPNPKP